MTIYFLFNFFSCVYIKTSASKINVKYVKSCRVFQSSCHLNWSGGWGWGCRKWHVCQILLKTKKTWIPSKICQYQCFWLMLKVFAYNAVKNTKYTSTLLSLKKKPNKPWRGNKNKTYLAGCLHIHHLATNARPRDHKGEVNIRLETYWPERISTETLL